MKNLSERLWYFMRYLIKPQQRKLKLLQIKNYKNIKLEQYSEISASKVSAAAESIYGNRWNYYSNALRREVIQTFEKAIISLNTSFEQVDYLEIGSAQGLSMSLIALMIEQIDMSGNLVSIDPYFEGGYCEGKNGIWGKELNVDITKNTKKSALELYKLLHIDVRLLEMPSSYGLKDLLKEERKFHLIYIDGSHEGLNPAVDFGLSCSLVYPGGIIMLDDHYWPDVALLKSLCDLHLEKIHECWKVAAYKTLTSY